MPRNPVLAGLLRDLPGYMERIGSGIRFMLREMDALGLPPPEFSEHFDFVVTFRNGGKAMEPEGLSERQLKALEMVRVTGSVSTSEYCAATGVSPSTGLRDRIGLVFATHSGAIHYGEWDGQNFAELTVTPDLWVTILADFRIANLEVTDAYPDGYWGAWIATSLTAVEDPATSAALTWAAVPIPIADRSSMGAVIRRWDLTTGLDTSAGNLLPNTPIHVYLRLLDRAGNPSERVLIQQVTLPKVVMPIFLPSVTSPLVMSR